MSCRPLARPRDKFENNRAGDGDRALRGIRERSANRYIDPRSGPRLNSGPRGTVGSVFAQWVHRAGSPRLSPPPSITGRTNVLSRIIRAEGYAAVGRAGSRPARSFRVRTTTLEFARGRRSGVGSQTLLDHATLGPRAMRTREREREGKRTGISRSSVGPPPRGGGVEIIGGLTHGH